MERMWKVLEKQGAWAILCGILIWNLINNQSQLTQRLDKYDESLRQINITLERLTTIVERIDN